jgi:hypothetical protein
MGAIFKREARGVCCEQVDKEVAGPRVVARRGYLSGVYGVVGYVECIQAMYVGILGSGDRCEALRSIQCELNY